MTKGSRALRSHLDVKAILLKDAALREEYSATKLTLSQQEWRDMGQYSSAKSDILGKILSKAHWADKDLPRPSHRVNNP
jgi:GrpB-like predicted nucleotidyltransferase (UPF0157 family)